MVKLKRNGELNHLELTRALGNHECIYYESNTWGSTLDEDPSFSFPSTDNDRRDEGSYSVITF
jgi:hypothetical protein